jgi:hypothetical protein
MFIFLHVLVSIPSVNYVTAQKNGDYGENYGSTEGGTLLWIRGSNFPERQFNTTPSIANAVTVQLINGVAVYECRIHNEDTTTAQLACYTPAVPEGDYVIRIVINGVSVPYNSDPNNNYVTFRSRTNNTPIIRGVSPMTGPPQRLLTVSGNFMTDCYARDTDRCFRNNVARISR